MEKALGALAFLYGVTQTTTGIAALTGGDVRRQQMSKYPLLRLFVPDDTTAAGDFMVIVMTIFGILCVFVGLGMMGISSRWATDPDFQDYANRVLGVALVAFYSLVAFTPVPIPKNPNDRALYVKMVIVGGLTFLMTPPAMRMWRNRAVDGPDAGYLGALVAASALLWFSRGL